MSAKSSEPRERPARAQRPRRRRAVRGAGRRFAARGQCCTGNGARRPARAAWAGSAALRRGGALLLEVTPTALHQCTAPGRSEESTARSNANAAPAGVLATPRRKPAPCQASAAAGTLLLTARGRTPGLMIEHWRASAGCPAPRACTVPPGRDTQPSPSDQRPSTTLHKQGVGKYMHV